MTQTMNIIRKHVHQHVAVDSCSRHGIGLSKCRVCLKSDRVGDASRTARHRKDMDALVGWDMRV